MKFFIAKLISIFILLFSVFSIECSFVRNRLIPLYEYTSALSLSEYKYVKRDFSSIYNKESLFFEDSEIRIHRTIHDDDSVIKCEEIGDTKCFLSVVAVDTDPDNSFMQNCLLAGDLPLDSTSIAISKNVAEHFNLSVGDEVNVKSKLFYDKVFVSGIFKNIYGLYEYNPSSKFYCVINRGEKYLALTNVSLYNFSNSEKDAPYSYNLKKIVKEKKIELICNLLVVFFIIFVLCEIALISYKKIFQLSGWFKTLFYLGKNRGYISIERTRYILFFALICLFLCILPSVFFNVKPMILFNGFTILLSSVLNQITEKFRCRY